jgi:hypothetical protein
MDVSPDPAIEKLVEMLCALEDLEANARRQEALDAVEHREILAAIEDALLRAAGKSDQI